MVGDAPPCVPLSRTRLCGPHWHLRYTVAAACKSVGKSSRETYCRYFLAHLRRWVLFMMGRPSDLVIVLGCSVIALRSYGHGLYIVNKKPTRVKAHGCPRALRKSFELVNDGRLQNTHKNDMAMGRVAANALYGHINPGSTGPLARRRERCSNLDKTREFW